MSRMLILSSLKPNNNAADAIGPAFVNKAVKRMLTAAVSAALCAGAVLAPAQAGKPVPQASTAPASQGKAQNDPLAGDTWHADNGTWPGTLVFDAKKKSVTLAPVGTTPMQADYAYTVKPAVTANVIEGTLRMTNSAKQVSNSTFRIQGKVLTLTYAGGPRPETYVRMSPKEEAAEMARLQKMIAEGRVRPLK